MDFHNSAQRPFTSIAMRNAAPAIEMPLKSEIIAICCPLKSSGRCTVSAKIL